MKTQEELLYEEADRYLQELAQRKNFRDIDIRHRIKLTFEAVAERITADDVVNMVVAETMAMCGQAPKPAAAAETEAPAAKKGFFGKK